MRPNDLPSPSRPERADPVSAEPFLRGLIQQATRQDGQPPFSDQSLVGMRGGSRELLLMDEVAAAILSPTEAELVVAPDARARGNGTTMLEAILAARPGELRIWAHGDHPAARALARSHGFEPVRELLQLRAPVVAPAHAEPVEPFRPGVDDEEWLRLNARAFATHPEQGRLSQPDLDALLGEPWFDPDDFLLLRGADGAIIGYCWLKIEGAVGEFYVVGVAPDRQGEGIGRRLMHAGFARLAARGIRTASLYVEADNVPALRLYRPLGFVDHSIDIQYARAT
ncbi:mycothiol synthase [Lacisediminihabitans sp.]|uniref:mycothiol synthase n=1 Tax=Lacisediminihabitans sp. TaxID=2787631 RepID=UPI00374DE127